MTDNEIIKALECCKMDDCENCPYENLQKDSYGCVIMSTIDAIALIKRQQAEIERLATEKDNLIKTYAECQVDFLKEFVKKLKEDIRYRIDATGDYELYEVFQDIDNLVEEMGCGE